MKTIKETILIIIFIACSFLIMTSIVSADDTTDPVLNFTDPTPGHETSQTETNVSINVSITEENLDEVVYNWNGINYTMYNDSLVLMYNFDNVASLGEGSSHVFDISGHGHNGTTQNGASPTTDGKYDGAYTFDGSNDHITIGIVEFGQAFTVSTWIKPTAWGTDVDQYIHNVFSNEGSAESSTFAFRLGSQGQSSLRQRLAIAIYQGGSANDYESSSDLTLNIWQHLAVSWDGSNVRFYINGVLDRTQSASITMNDGANTFMVANSPQDNRPYAGLIDELFVYNTTLSNSEIYQLYASNLKKFNQTQWYLYVNQSKNATAGLDIGTYAYQAFAKDINNNVNSTEERTIQISGASPPVPELSTIILMGIGLMALIGYCGFVRKKKW